MIGELVRNPVPRMCSGAPALEPGLVSLYESLSVWACEPVCNRFAGRKDTSTHAHWVLASLGIQHAICTHVLSSVCVLRWPRGSYIKVDGFLAAFVAAFLSLAIFPSHNALLWCRNCRGGRCSRAVASGPSQWPRPWSVLRADPWSTRRENDGAMKNNNDPELSICVCEACTGCPGCS